MTATTEDSIMEETPRPARTASVPPLPEQMREQARRAPGTFLYVVDPLIAGNGEVPGRAVVGAYRVNDDGEIDETFLPNAGYRPVPAGLGLPGPAWSLESALEQAVTEEGVDKVRTLLLEATVFTPAQPGHAGLIALDVGLDHHVVHVFTSERYLPETDVWRFWQRVPVREISAVLGEHHLVVNPGSAVELRIPGTDLT